MKQLLFILLLLAGITPGFSQSKMSYLDSIKSWRTNYIATHELLKTEKERAYLRFYPLHSDYRVLAGFELLADTAWFPMMTSSGEPALYRKYGRVTFRLRDTVLQLVLYQSQQLLLLQKPEMNHYLFIGFTDLTSGSETYGAGRYIDAEIGDIHDGKLLLDFNKAYNPYCAYSTGYSCPIPPKENQLPVAILAGEKTYAKEMH